MLSTPLWRPVRPITREHPDLRSVPPLDERVIVDRASPHTVRRLRHLLFSEAVLSVLGDAVALAVVAAAVRPGLRVVLAYAVGLLIARSFGRAYRPRLTLSVLDDAPRSLAATAAALGIAFGLVAVSGDARPAEHNLLVLVLFFVPAMFISHLLALKMGRIARTRLGVGERTLIVGAGRVGHGLADTLLAHPQLGLYPVGFTDRSPVAAEEDLPAPVLSTDVSELSRTIATHRVSTVVLAFSSAPESHAVDTIMTAHRGGCAVLIVPRMYELHRDGSDVEWVRGVPLVRLRPDPTLRLAWWVKRAADTLIAAAGLLVLTPLLLVTAAAVLVESGRPILFWQQRIGLDGRTFRLCKFRSMRPVPEAESQSTWNVAGDSRIGPVGHFLRRSSLDEVPQLWNIVRGNMSLVGPRPERPSFVERFSGEHERYWARHRVPVGLTGLAQVNGLRGDTSISERSRYDNYYIANWSLWLDVKILLLTAREVFAGSGG